MSNIEALFDWLLDGAPGATTAPEIAERLGNDLLSAGIPLARMAVFVTTLHPNVLGRAFFWEPGKPIFVKGDVFASYGRVRAVMKIANDAGFETVGVITKDKKDKS